MLSPPVPVAAIGLGWVTMHRHIPTIRGSARGRLVGVIDHQPGRAASVARALKLPLSATTQEAADIPWLDSIEAVTIGTPPLTHYALAASYLSAGKHVLIEKPMTMTVDQSHQLVALAKQKGRVLAVVHNFQFSRSVMRAKRMVTNGQLGEIKTIWGVQLSNPRRRLPVWYGELPLGLFYDESPHFFYLIRHLAGYEPAFRSVDIQPASDGSTTPKKITAQLDARGIEIQIDMTFQSPLSEWHIGVFGTEGAVLIDVFRDLSVVLPNDGLHLARNILRTSALATFQHWIGTFESGLRLSLGRLTYGNDEVFRRFFAACQGDNEALAGISSMDGLAIVQMQHRVIDAST